MEEHAVLNVVIDNFKGIERCPYCGERPKMMKWSDGKIEMWCRNLKCPEVSEEARVLYGENEKDLQSLTRKLIDKWNFSCKKIKRELKAVELENT